MGLIRPLGSTMGQSVQAGGGYRYRKDPDWTPGDRRYREPGHGELLPQNAKATTAKQRRMAEFTRRRLAGESKEQAAAALGIRPSTASYYEREFKDQQRRESRDA
jgi:hypothetical protein